jgi:hypothetical protein
MKHLKLIFTVFVLTATLLSCSKKDEGIMTYSVAVKLNYPSGYSAQNDSVSITLKNTVNNSSFTAFANAKGIAVFTVPTGVYQASATGSRPISGVSYNFNGLKDFTVADNWALTDSVKIDLAMSKASQIIIKELYNGGCTNTTTGGTTVFSRDQYVILYNNSDKPASLDNLCLGMALPFNSNGSTNADYVGGTLSYTDWIPAGMGIWYFSNGIILKPGQQIVVALANAVDNTSAYANSINFANSDYYCTYDMTQYSSTLYYPSPAGAIPASHYLKAIRYSGVTATAWTVSSASPAFFIFATNGTTPSTFANDASYTNIYNGSATQVRKKVPVDWVVDAIEVFAQGASTNYKRLVASVDAGSVSLTNQKGYSLYRNVDKTATEALKTNAGKLVYNYTGGTTDVVNGTTDPSGIDAEASIKNGARIIYKDTNSSTNDFHQRNKASLRSN